MAKAFPESLLEFEHWFRTEEACRDYLAQVRWPDGFKCPHCSGVGAWKSHDTLFRCHSCRRDVSVTTGTALHRSRLGLRAWFRIIWWATNQKSGLSALGLQRMMGIGSYETAWLSLQKLRRAMVRLGREPLTGQVEVDETFIGGVKRGGHSRQNKALVAVAAEIRGEGIGRIRLARISDNSSRSLVPFIRNSVAPGSTIVTDGWQAYGPIGAEGYLHKPTTIAGRGREASNVVLPRVNRISALMKRWILGTHQGRIEAGKIEPYLDEFAFRFNRRQSPSRGQLFYRLLGQCLVHGPTTFNQIKAKKL
jgi:transposase-like protein